MISKHNVWPRKIISLQLHLNPKHSQIQENQGDHVHGIHMIQFMINKHNDYNNNNSVPNKK